MDHNTTIQGDGLYEVTPADKVLRGMINRRRQLISPIDGLDAAEHQVAMKELFAVTGLDDYSDAVVAEMVSRPIVEARPASERQGVLDVYQEVMPLLLDWVLARTVKEGYTFNNFSRVGSPYIARLPSKRDELVPQFLDVAASGEDAARKYVADGWNMINIRLQPERIGRVREMTFISSDGSIHKTKVDKEHRLVRSADGSVSGYAQRTRLIFLPHKVNLATGFVDHALHGPELRAPACDHNMFGDLASFFPSTVQATLFTDIRHMDWYTGAVVRYRASLIGGMYETWINAMLDQPYLVPSDGWTNAWWVRVRGVSQLPSGVSPVAPIQKELMLCCYTKFLSITRGITLESALAVTLAGGDTSFAIRNYGDDNALAGDSSALASWMSFASELFAIEEEDPPKFLGFIFDAADRTFRLTPRSYLLKTWQNERPPDSMWRPNANYGWVQRREAYRRFGRAREMQPVFDAEDAVLAAHGMPWETVQKRAIEEERAFGRDGGLDFATLGKEYLLSDEARSRLPGYEMVDEKTATALTRAFVGAEVRAKLFQSGPQMPNLTLGG